MRYRLPILLLPDAVKHKALHDVLPQPTWREVRRPALDRAQYRCAVCKVEKPLDGHEVWTISKGVARLAEIVALCRTCHQATHLDLDMRPDLVRVLTRHWCKVNRCSRRVFTRYYEHKKAEYLRRKDQPYAIDYGRFTRFVRTEKARRAAQVRWARVKMEKKTREH